MTAAIGSIRAALVAATLLAPAGPAARDERRPGPPPPELVRTLGLSPFYRKHVDAGGLPILASDRVSDYALLEAAYLVDRMLSGRDDLRAELVRNRVRVVVMAWNELTTAVPEHSDLKPARYWDRRARGLGATPLRPAVSCGEENLLGYPGDPYAGENIFIHEFAHTIHEMALRRLSPEFEGRLRECYRRALDRSLWKGTYAATSPAEYWAEGVQDWFDCNQSPNAVHNEIDTREELERYDPDLAALIASVFPDRSWRYEPPSRRSGSGHLKGYDPSRAPRFRWDPELTEWYRTYESIRQRHRALMERLRTTPDGGKSE